MLPLHDRNPSRTTPVVNIALIAANILMFLYELSLGERLEGYLMASAFVPGHLFDGGAVTAGEWIPGLSSALLSMFLHGGWGHLLGNMLFLWIFGDNIEDRLGHFKYLYFYVFSGFAATFAHAFVSPQSMIPAIGASGAISGVLGAYLFLYPRARIVTVVWILFFIRLVEIPALVYLPFWFLLQAFSGFASLGARTMDDAGGVAWFAHIGGFVAGPLLLFLFGGFRRPPEPERTAWS
ncbi:MAG TPA: rhomboid family intramembrane serine protease [Thermoanaerobaculia bacterium]|jgi:membrane associated rhomboid family serine protease|nr:rhomboid family intramembrane serine protease [Thermoanaerobaculia bacterium]